MNNQYYVYVYIDPRDQKFFYVGKGIGGRKSEHHGCKDDDTKKGRKLASILEAGLNPLVRVIARDLTEEQALLVEKALIWSSQNTLSNISSGHFAEHFRPHDSLQNEILEFDYFNAIYMINMSPGVHRAWDDARRYGFVSAGQNWKKWGSKLSRLKVGDLVCPYVDRSGYCGVGRVTAESVPVDKFTVNGESIVDLELKAQEMKKSRIGTKDCEFLVAVEWLAAVPAKSALKVGHGVKHYRGVIIQLEDETTRLAIGKHFGVNVTECLGKMAEFKQSA